MTSTLQSIAAAIPSVGRAKLLINSNDDVVICAAVRTALTKVRFASAVAEILHAKHADHAVQTSHCD